MDLLLLFRGAQQPAARCSKVQRNRSREEGYRQAKLAPAAATRELPVKPPDVVHNMASRFLARRPTESHPTQTVSPSLAPGAIVLRPWAQTAGVAGGQQGFLFIILSRKKKSFEEKRKKETALPKAGPGREGPFYE